MPGKNKRKYNTRPSSNDWRMRPQVESLETRILLASDWTNPIDVYNVDGSDTSVESVSPIDALLVINELNAPTISDPQTGLLPELTASDEDPTVYMDVNGDGAISPIDALLVINRLNLNAESVAAPSSTFASANVIVGSRAALAGGISDDTLVNTETSRVQKFPDVASTSLGDSVVVWQSFAQDGRGWGIYGQRFDPTGAAVGGEFQVNTTTRGGQSAPAVAVSDDGSFVVTWHSVQGADGSGFGVYAQQFDSSGNPVGDELLVNTTTTGKQFHPDVAFSGDDFTVVWQGRGEGDVNGIYARTFSGGVGGDEILVNTYTKGFQGAPVVAGNGSGNTVVAWEGRGEDDVYGVFMRDIGSGGDQVLVNVESRLTQRIPAIAVDDSGGIVVAWHNPPEGVWARTFAADGTGGDVIQVSQTDPGVQTHPDVAFVLGGFAVSWHGKGGGDHRGTLVRTFAADGSATSDEMLVNQTTQAAQVRSAIAPANEGYIIVWQGRGEGDNFGTFARFFETDIAGPFSIDSVADGTVDEGNTFTTTVSVTDTDESGDSPTFSLSTAPVGATIDSATGAVSWATTEADGPGTFEFVVVVSEGDFSVSDTFNVTVNEVNAAPVIEDILDVAVLLDNTLNFTVSATDADAPAQTLTFTATGTPAWLTFDPATQTFNGTPTDGDEGDSTVEVTVDDGSGGTASQTFVVTATGNQSPVVATEIADVSVNEAESASINVAGSFNDPEGDLLSFSSPDLPAWASIDSSTGVITGTPGNNDVGVANVTITATDGFGGQVSDTFQLTVVDVNTMTPSALESSFRVASTAAEDTSVGTVFAQDFDPSAVLNYSITSGNDAGAFAINSSTGEITVDNTTALASIPTNNSLIVTVSDGVNSTTAPATIVVSDAAAVVGYSLQVVDPTSGDVLTTVSAGQTVHLVLNVQTIGDGSAGVFSAYADIVYNPEAASIATLDPSLCEPLGGVTPRINGNVCHSATYINGQFADVSTDGLINEAGGTDGITVLGNATFEVLRVPMTIADLPDGAVVAFDTNDADAESIRATTVFNNNDELTATQLDFSGATVTVTSQDATVAAVDAVFAEEDEE